MYIDELSDLLSGIRLEFKIRGWADHMLTDTMLQRTVADTLDWLEKYKYATACLIFKGKDRKKIIQLIKEDQLKNNYKKEKKYANKMFNL